jgi:hypothetical protein
MDNEKTERGEGSTFFRIKLIGRCAAQRRRNVSDPAVTVALKFAVKDLIVKRTESVTANLLPTGPSDALVEYRVSSHKLCKLLALFFIVCRGPSHSGIRDWR